MAKTSGGVRGGGNTEKVAEDFNKANLAAM